LILIPVFSSVLAKKLLLRLQLEAPEAEIALSVSHDHKARILDALADLPSELRRRVSLLEGDFAAIDMGLSGKEYRALLDRIRVIHFIAPMPSPSVAQKRAEQLIIGGVREALELGRNCSKLERIVYYGSALVSGDRTGSVLESDLEKNQGFRSPVEECLAIAERMVRARFSEIPISVLRPSLISGDAQTGETDREGPVGFLISLLLNSPQELPMLIPGDGDIAMNLTSADYVIDVAQRILSLPWTTGKTFHISDPEPLSVRRFVELVAQAAGRKSSAASLPPRLSKALFNAPGPLSWAKTPRALIELMTTPVRYDSRNTDLALKETEIRAPRFESYVELLVGAAKRRREMRKKGE
jgi:nucleoside-diphosphate-sugar epimerase